MNCRPLSRWHGIFQHYRLPRRLCSSLYEGSGCACLAWKLPPQRLNCPFQTSTVLDHFTKDDFDPSNDLKVSLRIKPQKVRFVRRMLLFTTKFSNANCETSTAGISRKPTQEGGYVCSITQRTQVHWIMDAKCWLFLVVQVYITQRNPEMTGLWNSLGPHLVLWVKQSTSQSNRN